MKFPHRLLPLFIVLALVGASHLAQAQTGKSVLITCAAVTTYADNTPIPAGTTVTYTLYGGLKGAPKSVRDTSTTCRFQRDNVSAGTQEWYLTAGASYLGSPVIESVPSNIVSLVIDTPPPDRDGDGVIDSKDACPDVKGTASNGCIPVGPAAPTAVTATQIAYEYRPSTNTMVALGLVPEGALCGPETQQIAGKVYCRVKLADALPVVWPQNRALREVWVLRGA